MTRTTIKHLDADMFSNVSGLQALDLRGNMLTYLPSDIFDNMTALVTLHLDDNHLLELENTVFHGLKNMKILTLSGNRLVHIRNDTFADLYSLVSLDLSHNAFTYVNDRAFGVSTHQFISLTDVHLSHNVLDRPPLLVWYLPSLATLDLSYNNITFFGLASVTHLIRQSHFTRPYCGISPKPHLLTMSNVARLEIDVTFNHITGMDLQLLDDETIEDICVYLFAFSSDLAGNDVVCDCNIFSLYELVSKTEGIDSQIFCSQPMSLKNYPLQEVDDKDIGCHRNITYCPALCDCWIRSVDDAVTLNCSYRNLASFPPLIPSQTIDVIYTGNNLKELAFPVPWNMSDLKSIDLSSNRLARIDPRVFPQLCSNCTLYLHDNALTHLPRDVRITRRGHRDLILIVHGTLLLTRINLNASIDK